MVAKLDTWHHTKAGVCTFACIELAIAYGFASWAIDNGSLWLYAATLIFFVGALQNVVRLMGALVHGRNSR
ncbi:MAG TPA: hypothetical protein VFN56_04850 [Candidatus Saccharimonadales bacterium]|nr:hypothetical protein [Candidatus Saccharimonadales bacterium]